MKKVMFVCSGNICRSPLAEAILRKLSDKILSASSGIESYHIGERPDYRTLKVAKINEVEMDGIVAKRFKKGDFEEFDYIFGMSKKHVEALLRHAPPKAREKIFLLLEFTKTPNIWENEVKDPYYGDEEDFTQVYEVLFNSITDLIKLLKA